MVRLPRNQARLVFAILAGLKANGTWERFKDQRVIETLYEQAGRHGDANPEDADIMQYALDYGPRDAPLDVEESLQMLYQQLTNDPDENAQSILDQVIEIIEGRFSGATYAGDTVRYLRSVVFLPAEAAKATQQDRESLKCEQCGTTLSGGEGATLRVNGSIISLLCSGCVQPTYYRCRMAGCRAALEGNRKWCGKHKDGKPAAEPVVEPAQPLMPADDVARIHEQLRQMAGLQAEPRPGRVIRAAQEPGLGNQWREMYEDGARQNAQAPRPIGTPPVGRRNGPR